MTETKTEKETVVTLGNASMGDSSFYATEPIKLEADPQDLKPIGSEKKEARHGPGKVEYYTDSKGNIFKRKLGDYEYQKRCEKQAG